MTKAKINFVFITDSFGNVIYKKNVLNETKNIFTEALVKNITSNVSELISNSNTNNINGFVLYNKVPVLISAQRVTKSDGSGRSPGFFIFAKYYDKYEIDTIKQDTQLQIGLVDYDKGLILNNDSAKKDTFVKVNNENFITIYGLLNNIFSKPSFFVKVTSQRKIFRKAKITMNFYLLILLVVSILFSFSIFILIYVFVVKKVKIINSTIENVHNSHDVFTSIILKGNDEISELGSKFNNMFYRLKKSDEAIIEIQKEYTLKLEESNLKLENEITDRILAENQIHHFIYYDALTELFNRKKMREDVNILLDNKTEKFAILFMDLDKFKSANDTYGHEAGDYILKITAVRLKSIIRSTDEVYRIGGDEFIIILRNLKASANAEKIAVAALETLSIAFTYNENQLFVGACIGISIFPEHGIDADTLIKQADSAMYEVKRNGGNGYKIYSS